MLISALVILFYSNLWQCLVPGDYTKRKLKTYTVLKHAAAPSTNNVVARLGTLPPVTLSPAVFVFAILDVTGDKSECMNQVDRAAGFSTRSLQLVLTTYFYDIDNNTFPESFAVRSGYTSNGEAIYQNWTPALITESLRASCTPSLRASQTPSLSTQDWTCSPIPFGG